MSVVVVEVMTIVGGDEGDACFFGKTDQFAIDILFDGQSLILNFEEEIPFAKNVAKSIGILARLIVLLVHNRLSYRPTQAGQERNQAFAVLRKYIVVDARTVVETLTETGGCRLH